MRTIVLSLALVLASCCAAAPTVDSDAGIGGGGEAPDASPCLLKTDICMHAADGGA